MAKRTSPTPPRRGGALWPRIRDVINEIVPEGVALLLLLLTIAAADKLLRHLLGDYKFFDLLPVRWAFDLAHLTIILLFVWRIIKRFRA